MDVSMDTGEAFEPRPSLWAEICRHCPASETEEIRRVVGVSLLEQNSDLHKEVSALLDIWRDIRREIAVGHERASSGKGPKRLPEPPLVRERLRSEILFFVENLRERAAESGANAESVLAATGQDKSLLSYVMMTASHESLRRPGTASSGRQTPLRDLSTPSSAGSRTQSRMSSSSIGTTLSQSGHSASVGAAKATADDVSRIAQKKKITMHSIDEIADRLREALSRERELLLGDVAFLHDSIERSGDEMDAAVAHARRMSEVEEPSLQQLREYGTRLEKEYLSKSKANLTAGASPHSSPAKGHVAMAAQSPTHVRASVKRPVSTPSPASSASTKRRAGDASGDEGNGPGFDSCGAHAAGGLPVQPSPPPVPLGGPPRSSSSLRAKRAFGAIGSNNTTTNNAGMAAGRGSAGVGAVGGTRLARHAVGIARDGGGTSDSDNDVVMTDVRRKGPATVGSRARPPLPPKRSDSAMSVSTIILDDGVVVADAAVESESDFQLSSNDEEFFREDDPPRRTPVQSPQTGVTMTGTAGVTGTHAVVNGGQSVNPTAKSVRMRPTSAQRLRSVVQQYRTEA
eukprot:Opistho-2@53040